MRIGNLTRSQEIRVLNRMCTTLCLGAYTAGILGRHREAITSARTRSISLGLVVAQVDFRRCTNVGFMAKLVTRSILVGLV